MKIPERMLILEGGSSGWRWLPSIMRWVPDQHCVERMAQLIPGADADLIKPRKKLRTECEAIYLNTGSVSRVEADKERFAGGIFEGEQAPQACGLIRCWLQSGVGQTEADRCRAAGINVDERGFIPVDKQMRTSVPHILQLVILPEIPCWRIKHPMKVSCSRSHCWAQVAFDARTIPSVALPILKLPGWG
ncbi:MAG: hypothetical protein P0107_01440 [Nitrosomonas sp.]|nr:hypothetical protein [Nitrosomonas sp.]